MRYKVIYRQWFVTGYDEAKAVLSSPHALTRPQIDVMLDVRPYTKLNHSTRAFLENFLVGVDPPDHTRLRGLVNRAFTPRQIARLDERMDTIIDELLRFDTPVRSDPRAAAADIDLGGTVIPNGGNIAVMLMYANRDPRRFSDPDVLKLNREDPAPISFGHGIHYCLGANLARMELRKGLHKLIDAFGDYTIDATQTEWKASLTLRGPLHLALTAG